ncbi:MAG: hypothetical protein JOZ09_16620 [Pseudonocardiales bacterium]|nr:hypothetical protein [Pseudonocardiales bacterium]
MNTTAAERSAAKLAVIVLFTAVAEALVYFGIDTAPAFADNALVIAESFESVSGLPAGWRFMEYTPGNSTVTIASGAAADGTHFMRIVSRQPNHARVVLPVRVTPNTSYQFHAMVKANGANENMAAVLGTEGQYAVTPTVRTDTRWQPLDLYIKVGSQTAVDLNMGLGYFGQLNVGTADFDAVTVTQVSAIPNGATVADLRTPPNQETAAGNTVAPGPNKDTWVFVLVGILVVVGIGAAVFLMRRGDREPEPEGDTELRQT